MDKCSVLVITSLIASAFAADASTTPFYIPPDAFSDPHNDPLNPLRYIASNTLTAIAFSLVLTVAILQSLATKKWGARYMLAMVIGGYTFALGIGTRFGLNKDPRGKGIYIVQYLFVVLSPCAYIAATYVLLGRLARFLRCNSLLIVPPHRITQVFVSSDITTFLIQAAGGGLSASASSAKDLKKRDVGTKLFLIGIALQFASFAIFSIIYFVFLVRVYLQRKDVWTQDSSKKWYNDWRALGGALVISCIGILIRSVYRTVELSEGFGGHLATHEVYFYTLDTLPLFLATSVFVFFWPGRFIHSHPEDQSTVEAAEKEQKSSNDSSSAQDNAGSAPNRV